MSSAVRHVFLSARARLSPIVAQRQPLFASRLFSTRSSPVRAAAANAQQQQEEKELEKGKKEKGGEEAHVIRESDDDDDDDDDLEAAEKWSIVARMQLRDVLQRIQSRYENRPMKAPGATVVKTHASGAREATKFWMCTPSENVEDVLRRMIDANLSAQLVVENNKVVGTLTDRDYITKVVLNNCSGGSGAPAAGAQQQKQQPRVVADVMSPSTVAAKSGPAEGLVGTPDTKVLQALKLMGEKAVRILPVMEGENLLGFLTYFDLVDATVQESSDEIERLVCYIGGHDYAVGCNKKKQ